MIYFDGGGAFTIRTREGVYTIESGDMLLQKADIMKLRALVEMVRDEKTAKAVKNLLVQIEYMLSARR